MPTTKFDNHSVTLGAWCTIPSSFAVEVLARSGVDWVCVDLQHGLIDPAGAVPLFQAAAITGTLTLSRVSSQNPAEIQRILDYGAHGVIAPMIETAEQARSLVESCQYPPVGLRSWGPSRPALMTPGYTTQSADAAMICGANVETALGIENLDEITAVEGLNLVMVGPNDLALSMGLAPGATTHQASYEAALRSVPEVCARHDVVPGIFANSLAQADEYIRWGYRAISVVHDADTLGAAARAAVKQVRSNIQSTTIEGDKA